MTSNLINKGAIESIKQTEDLGISFTNNLS